MQIYKKKFFIQEVWIKQLILKSERLLNEYKLFFKSIINILNLILLKLKNKKRKLTASSF